MDSNKATSSTLTPPPQAAIASTPSPISRGTERSPKEWLDLFLNDQQDLTAVERFSQVHESASVPAQAKYYQDLIPLSKPTHGQQYAFEVDLDSCTGCKACVTACHSMNGLDDDEAWRQVGLLVSPTNTKSSLPMLQMVTAACHHCAHPACLDGCPVMAYDKDPVTGIVKHLDDQCIGCQYCVLKCPYDVPKYNAKRGIVRKCDMCSSRLAVNEAPACVQACPNTAIRIKLVDVDEMKKRAAQGEFLPGAPKPDYTIPTTTYKTNRPEIKALIAADQFKLEPDHGHTPLVLMLVIMQLAVGAFLGEAALGILAPGPLTDALRPYSTLAAFATIALGLVTAQFHLGRPLFAFRAFLGLRTSWLSREIIAFGGFAKCGAAYALTFWLDEIATLVPAFSVVLPYVPLAQKVLGVAAIASGLVATFSSVMVYVDTRRPLWTMRFTFPKFFGTALILGTASIPLQLLIAAKLSGLASPTDVMILFAERAMGVLSAVGLAKVLFELSLLKHESDAEMTPYRKAAMLLSLPLGLLFRLRITLALAGTVVIPLMLALGGRTMEPQNIVGLSILVFIMALGSELLERHLFFRASVPLKMPGGSAV